MSSAAQAGRLRVNHSLLKGHTRYMLDGMHLFQSGQTAPATINNAWDIHKQNRVIQHCNVGMQGQRV